MAVHTPRLLEDELHHDSGHHGNPGTHTHAQLVLSVLDNLSGVLVLALASGPHQAQAGATLQPQVVGLAQRYQLERAAIAAKTLLDADTQQELQEIAG
jgi:hypothetical protein